MGLRRDRVIENKQEIKKSDEEIANEIIKSQVIFDKQAKQGCLIIIIAIALVIGGIFVFNKIKNANMSPEEKIAEQIEDELGKYTNRKDDNGDRIKKVRKVKIDNDFLYIDLSADDSIFGNRTDNIHDEIIEVMRVIDIPKGIKEIKFTFYSAFRDENFNLSEDEVLTCFVTKEKFDINWKNVSGLNIHDVTSNYWKHPDY